MSKNKWQGMERELARLRAVAHSIIIEKQPEPPGWDWDDYKRRRNWILEKQENRFQGEQNRIMGGPEAAAAFNKWLWDTVDMLNEARKEGLLPDDFDDNDGEETAESEPTEPAALPTETTPPTPL